MTIASQQQEVPGDDTPMPQVIASYASYLETRTELTPEVAVTGEHACVTINTEDKKLVLTFQFGRGGWSLHSAEVRHGEQTKTFARGKLAAAVAVLMAA